MIKSIAITALLSGTSARWDNKDTDKMNCGRCIRTGNNFCFQGADGMPMSLNSKHVPHVCCKKGDDSCAAAQDDTYSCSFDYTNEEYAMSMCPQKQEKCGSKKEIVFDEEGTEEKIRVFNLTLGDTCTYKIHAKCGAPHFKVDGFSNLQANTTLDVTWAEWN